MTFLPLPALDGRAPLGFLAALGVLRLATVHGHHTARLSWSAQDCTAQLHDAYTEIPELAAFLFDIVKSIPGGGVLPNLPEDFPPLGAAPDQLRLPRPQLRDYTERLRDRDDPERTREIERWISSLVTDLQVDDKGRAAISQLTAPSGKQSMRTMLEKPLAVVRANPATLTEALIGWRRYPGVTGEYLDHLVLFDAADAPDGKSLERGVPGATWLALMAYPLLLTTEAGVDLITSGWRTVRESGRVSRRFVYPLWSRPVGLHGVRALLEHPAVSTADVGRASRSLATMSVFRVCGAERQRLPGRTFAGVLTPVRASTRPNGKKSPNDRTHPKRPGGGRSSGPSAAIL